MPESETAAEPLRQLNVRIPLDVFRIIKLVAEGRQISLAKYVEGLIADEAQRVYGEAEVAAQEAFEQARLEMETFRHRNTAVDTSEAAQKKSIKSRRRSA